MSGQINNGGIKETLINTLAIKSGVYGFFEFVLRAILIILKLFACVSLLHLIILMNVKVYTMTAEMMNKEEVLLDMADQQLTGFAHARRGYSAETLVQEMNLSREEWLKLKAEERTRLNEDDEREVDAFFGITSVDDAETDEEEV